MAIEQLVEGFSEVKEGLAQTARDILGPMDNNEFMAYGKEAENILNKSEVSFTGDLENQNIKKLENKIEKLEKELTDGNCSNARISDIKHELKHLYKQLDVLKNTNR